MKYDPSKYCHNLKKIAEDVTHATPVSSLTWELEGGDNPMNKKQRGEFCAVHSPPPEESQSAVRTASICWFSKTWIGKHMVLWEITPNDN